MKISNLEIKDHLILCASAQLDEGTEEIREDLLDHVLVEVAYKADGTRVHLNETAFLFIFLNKIAELMRLTLTSSSFLAKAGSYLFLNLPAS